MNYSSNSETSKHEEPPPPYPGLTGGAGSQAAAPEDASVRPPPYSASWTRSGEATGLHSAPPPSYDALPQPQPDPCNGPFSSPLLTTRTPLQTLVTGGRCGVGDCPHCQVSGPAL